MSMGTGRASFAHGVRGFAVATLCILLTAGCATVERIAYTQQEQTHAVVPGFPDARVWADDPIVAQRGIAASAGVTKQPTILALSGGGADGAFGAGLLNGWSARGNRPQFSIVTGASAGALIAPFAYLGSGYDEVLRSVFAERRDGKFSPVRRRQRPCRSRPVQGRTVARADREICRCRNARGGRAAISHRPQALHRHHQSRRPAHRDLGHGADCVQRKSEGARPVPQGDGSLGQHSRHFLAGADRGRSGRQELRRDACRWRRHRQYHGGAGSDPGRQQGRAPA